jgi:DNA replication protein DnaC
MNNEATIEKMNQMRLTGMARAFKNAVQAGIRSDFTPDELVAHVTDAEFDERNNRRISRLLTQAKFRYKAAIQEISDGSSRNIDKNVLLRFTDKSWLRNGENIIITGATGVGKSFVACSIGNQACLNGFKVMYSNCMKLFSNLKYARADGSYSKEMEKIQKQDLIILDDFGLHVLDSPARLMLLEILEDRHGIKSTIITSQLPVSKWHEVIGEATIADAICDRIVHSAYKIELKGDSMRKNKVVHS